MHQSLAKYISLNQRPKGHTENRSRNPHMHLSIDNKHWQCVSINSCKTLPGRIVPFIRQYWWPWMCSKVKITVKKETHCRTGNWCPHYQKIHRQHKVLKIQYSIWNKISIDLNEQFETVLANLISVATLWKLVKLVIYCSQLKQIQETNQSWCHLAYT